MCLECSGRHRALGVHISFVRSVTMDSWTEKQVRSSAVDSLCLSLSSVRFCPLSQIKMMASGGNARCNSFLSQYGVSSATHSIAQKYNSPPAQLYRERLLSPSRALPSTPDSAPGSSRWSRVALCPQSYRKPPSSSLRGPSSRALTLSRASQRLNMLRDKELSKNRFGSLSLPLPAPPSLS
jgi:hypothetical protein